MSSMVIIPSAYGSAPPRWRRLVVPVPYEPGSPDFCFETVERNLRAAANALLDFNPADGDQTEPQPILGRVQKASNFPDVALAQSTEYVLVADIDTISNEGREATTHEALQDLQAFLDSKERSITVRLKAWKQRRADRRAIKKQLSDARKRNGFA